MLARVCPQDSAFCAVIEFHVAAWREESDGIQKYSDRRSFELAHFGENGPGSFVGQTCSAVRARSGHRRKTVRDTDDLRELMNGLGVTPSGVAALIDSFVRLINNESCGKGYGT